MQSRSFALLFSVFGGVLALLHLYAGLFPSGINWGIHLFAFFPPAVTFGAPLLMLLTVVPQVQRVILNLLENGVQRFQQLPRIGRLVSIVALVAGVGLLLWVGRERAFFLGDGLLAMRNLDTISAPDAIPGAYKNAPVPAFIIWKLSAFFGTVHIEPSAQLAFQVFSVACGVAAVFVLWMLVKCLASSSMDRMLAYLFIVASGGTQLFFGYVETYTIAYLAVLLFAWLSFAYLDGKFPLALPSIAFGVLVTCHFGMICMVSAMVFLFYHAFTKRRFAQIVVSGLAMIGTVVLLLWASGYSWGLFNAVFFNEGSSHLVPLGERTSGWQAYTLISLWHIVDLANLYGLVSPFSLIILCLLVPVTMKTLSIKDPQWIFIMIIGLTSLAFTVFMNFDIGMSRDWDLLSPYVLGTVITAAFIWVRGIQNEPVRRRMLVMMAMITTVQTVAYITVNSNVTRSLARFEQLPDNRLWGNGAIAYSYEDLWTYYRDRNEYEQASQFAEKCLLADPTSDRRWANGGQAFEKAGYPDRAMRAYEKAIQLGSQYPWVYVNLGSVYSKVDRLDEAIKLFHRAMDLDPNVPMAAYNLGTLYGAQRHEFEKALPYLMRAVATDSLHAPSWQNLGTCFASLGRRAEMIRCYEKALELAPNDSSANMIRRTLQAYQRPR